MLAALALTAALAAAPDWAATSFDERASILLRAADLMSGPWREKIAAATMLGQSKSVQQAEIDAPGNLLVLGSEIVVGINLSHRNLLKIIES